MIRGALVCELVSLSLELMSRQQVRETQRGVKFCFFKIINASQMKVLVCCCLPQILLSSFLKLSCTLYSFWLLSASTNPFTNACFPFHFDCSFSGFRPSFFGIVFPWGLAIVDSEYVASLRASHFKLVPDVLYAHLLCEKSKQTSKKHSLSHFLGQCQLWFLYVDYKLMRIHLTDMINTEMVSYFEDFLWLLLNIHKHDACTKDHNFWPQIIVSFSLIKPKLRLLKFKLNVLPLLSELYL